MIATATSPHIQHGARELEETINRVVQKTRVAGTDVAKVPSSGAIAGSPIFTRPGHEVSRLTREVAAEPMNLFFLLKTVWRAAKCARYHIPKHHYLVFP
jgi:hypothetical protein